jgi:protein-disulfide isomerase
MEAGQGGECYNVSMEENQVEPEKEARVVRRRSAYPVPARPVNWSVWLALPFVFLFGLGLGWIIWGGSSSAVSANVAQTPDTTSRVNVTEDNNPAIGPVGAPVTIIEFSDYQCPYCIRWEQTVYSQLLADYKGKIRFVYRDLPLTELHPNAQSAAEAADCAGAQGYYWQFHDALFSEKYGLGAQAYDQYASDLKLDLKAFDACVADHRFKDEVDADANYAAGLGIHSTPTFYINGLLVVGAQPYSYFQQAIDKELAGQSPKK